MPAVRLVGLFGAVVLCAGLTSCGGGVQVPAETRCGTVLWSGREILPTMNLPPPPAGARPSTAPARSLLPPPGKSGGPIYVVTIGDDCDHGAVVTVSAPKTYRTYAVAHAEDGGIVGFTLNSVGPSEPPEPLTIAAFRNGREIGYFSNPSPPGG
jgi:hypothetical protein